VSRDMPLGENIRSLAASLRTLAHEKGRVLSAS
jgi:hypothetical protein